MIVETKQFNKTREEMKRQMTAFDKKLFDSIVNDDNLNDLEVLLTLTFIGGKSKGVQLSMETIKDYCDENSISLD